MRISELISNVTLATVKMQKASTPKCASVAVGIMLSIAASGAGATSLTVDDVNSLPVNVNQLSIGDSGNQTTTTTMTNLTGYGYLLNQYYLQPTTAEVFNYSISYLPVSSSTTETRVWNGTVNLNTGFSSGVFLGSAGPVATSPGYPATASGSFSMVVGTTYDLIAGLYAGPYPNNTPTGSYDLVWSVTSSPAYPSVLSVTGGGGPPPAPAPTPLPSTWLMLLSGFVGFGFFAHRGTKKNAAALAA